MKEYEVWLEGFKTNGESSNATLWGKIPADTFQRAFQLLCIRKGIRLTEKEIATTSLWGCKAFDNEKDARKSFG